MTIIGLKSRYYLATLLLIIMCQSCQNKYWSNAQKVNLLEARGASVNEILSDVKSKFQKNYELENHVYVLRSEQKQSSLEVIVSLYSKSDFKKCQVPKKFKLFGSYKYDKTDVVVYGESNNLLFKKTNNSQDLKYLVYREARHKDKSSEIPLPPRVFEPPVWIFKWIDGTFKYLEEAQFNLIE